MAVPINTVGWSDYSTHKAIGKFAEHHIDMASCVHRKCQTRACASGDINKTLECVIITDSKFSNRVRKWMTPKSTSMKVLTIWLEQLDFCLNRCQWKLPDQHIANCILPDELFFNILMISTVYSHEISKFLISEPDSSWVPTLWLIWPDQHAHCFRCVVYNVMRSSICATYLQECLKSSYRGCKWHHISSA